MASFSFNFNFKEESADTDGAKSPEAPVLKTGDDNPALLPPARPLKLDDRNQEVDMKFPSEELLVPLRITGDPAASKFKRPLAFQRIDEERVALSAPLAKALHTAKGPSDLVSGVYEGGLRVWEGSLDLVSYLDANRPRLLQTDSGTGKKGGKKGKQSRNNNNKKKQSSRNGNRSSSSRQTFQCLELGCGQGFPGIYVLRAKMASSSSSNSNKNWEVCFSDFNEEVLTR
jgi:hypothetical protein